ncbi:BAHD acyltransferase [Actinidia chinensis var. chinensis]|uniref:BAHD acyltransferase n=1 Tax=Actinidia chinensis var. chinensis TaxID=1590841 RepID=A0A2R6R295_ACTCC|nr:BAHD acyltransferase [Actinidia chinensis var. chinensis]
MKVEIIARETIKPSSPTPHHNRSFKLSFIDQVALPIHTRLVLFYSHGEGGYEEVTKRSQLLKESLSQTLTRFYPFAGRIKDHMWVDCNDDGAEYLEARVNSPLSDVLGQPKMETMKEFIPIPTGVKGPLFLVQATFFQCGGMGLGMSISHKIADAATFTALITGWANAALGFPDAVTPDFCAATLFPPREEAFPVDSDAFDHKRRVGISRRYVFDGSKIAALQAKSTSEGVPQPTRVEAVSALLWQSALAASRSNLTSTQMSSSLIWSVNLRPRLMPPLSKHSFGNLAIPIIPEADESETDLSSFICHLKRGIAELKDNYGNKLEVDERLSLILDQVMKITNLLHKVDTRNSYALVSWCKFPLYEADFGWGKPTWVTVGDVFEVANVIVLADTRDGSGIEAWVTLTEEDMALFETNQELRMFGSLNPSALS